MNFTVPSQEPEAKLWPLLANAIEIIIAPGMFKSRIFSPESTAHNLSAAGCENRFPVQAETRYRFPVRSKPDRSDRFLVPLQSLF